MKNFTMQAMSQGREIVAVCHNFPRIFPAEMQRLGDWGRLSGGYKEVYFTSFQAWNDVSYMFSIFNLNGLVKKISGARFSSLFRFVHRAKKFGGEKRVFSYQNLTRTYFPRSLFSERGTTRNIFVHRRPEQNLKPLLDTELFHSHISFMHEFSGT